MAAKKETGISIETLDVQQGRLILHILGTTPIIFNRMSQKAQRDLLFPPRKKNAAEKASSLKHIPIQEFMNSPYLNRKDDKFPTFIMMPSTAFKKSIQSAALDIPGSTKAEMGRLVWVEDEFVPIWGIPKLRMDVVRMKDAARTPDIRTRASIEHWATVIRVRYLMPIIRDVVVGKLAGMAGMTQGIGEWRAEKGGPMGRFEIVDHDDRRWKAIVENGGRQAQIEGMNQHECANEETQELLDWFEAELGVRGWALDGARLQGSKFDEGDLEEVEDETA